MACEFTTAALRDLEAILAYIADHNPARAVSFVEEVIGACEDRAAFPRLSRRRETPKGDVYTFPFHNYVIIHRIRPDGNMLVLRVVHAARDFNRFL